MYFKIKLVKIGFGKCLKDYKEKDRERERKIETELTKLKLVPRYYGLQRRCIN